MCQAEDRKARPITKGERKSSATQFYGLFTSRNEDNFDTTIFFIPELLISVGGVFQLHAVGDDK